MFLCSDGACGTLDDDRMADILAHRHPRLRRRGAGARQPRGRQHRQRHLRGRRRHRRRRAEPTALRRCWSARPPTCPAGAARGRGRGLFRGHRSGDTGEIEPVPADGRPRACHVRPTRSTPRPRATRPATAGRHAWLRRLLVAAVLLGLGWVALRRRLVVEPAAVLRRRGRRQGHDLPRHRRQPARRLALPPLRGHRRRARPGSATSTPSRSARASSPTTWRTRG